MKRRINEQEGFDLQSYADQVAQAFYSLSEHEIIENERGYFSLVPSTEVDCENSSYGERCTFVAFLQFQPYSDEYPDLDLQPIDMQGPTGYVLQLGPVSGETVDVYVIEDQSVITSQYEFDLDDLPSPEDAAQSMFDVIARDVEPFDMRDEVQRALEDAGIEIDDDDDMEERKTSKRRRVTEEYDNEIDTDDPEAVRQWRQQWASEHSLPYNEDTDELESFAFPGAAPIIYLDRDNQVLCADCANESMHPDEIPNFRPITAMADEEDEDGFPTLCDNCSKEVDFALRNKGNDFEESKMRIADRLIKEEMEQGELFDLDSYTEPDREPPRIKTSYEIVTPESAERGDVEDQGWEDEEGEVIEPWDEDQTLVDAAADWLGGKGSLETSDGISYYEIDPRLDYKTGSETRYTYHLDGFTPEEEGEIWDQLVKMKVVYS